MFNDQEDFFLENLSLFTKGTFFLRSLFEFCFILISGFAKFYKPFPVLRSASSFLLATEDKIMYLNQTVPSQNLTIILIFYNIPCQIIVQNSNLKNMNR